MKQPRPVRWRRAPRRGRPTLHACSALVARLAVFAVAATSCAAPRVPDAVAPPRPVVPSMPAVRTPIEASDPSPRFAHSDTLSLRDALALTLEHNPRLAAFGWEFRAAEARALRLGRPANPTLEVSMEDIGARARDGGATNLGSMQPQSTVQLSQIVELGGKRMQRRALGAHAVVLAAWDYEAARIDALTLTTHAYIEVLTGQAELALAERSAALADEVRQSVSARVAAGHVSPVEETRAEVALAASRVEVVRAAQMLASRRTRLAASWGGNDRAVGVAGGTLDIADTLPALEALEARLSANPDLARWAAEMRLRESALRLERRRRIPDLTVSAGYRSFQGLGVETFIAGVAIPLPLFDWNRGAIHEARSLVEKAKEERRVASAAVATRLGDVYGVLSGSHAEVRALRETVLPGARRTFDAIAEGYRLGRFTYLEYLDAQRTLIGANAQYLHVLAEYNKAAADVERLTGAPLVAVPPTAH